MLPNDCHENQALLLSHATECLAKAAVALSDAAEAVAAAARSFISETGTTGAISMPQSLATTDENEGVASVSHQSDLDLDSFSTVDSLSTPTKHTNNAHGALDKLNELPPELTTGDSIPITGDDEAQGSQSASHIRVDDNIPATDDSPETKVIPELPPSYRILLDDEADVFLTVCYLIRQGRKTVCYLRSSITTLDVYQDLLRVTEVPVHIIKSSSSQEIERVVKSFQDDHSSVLLLPATYSPSFIVEGPDSWVIHVGWPTNEQLYERQITAHQAKNNVFVAYSGDIDIYPSSPRILTRTEPWPRDELLFKKTCTVLRPLFNKNLDAIPAKTKAKIYPDWITIHGTLGPYHPPTWTATILVYRANVYFLDVLRYGSSASSNYSGEEFALPAVSAKFVARQKLESAVEAGVLQVKPSSEAIYLSPHSSAVTVDTPLLNKGVLNPMDDRNSTSVSAPVADSGGPSAPFSSNPKPERVPASLYPSNATPTPPRPASEMNLPYSTDGNQQSDRQRNQPSSGVTEYLIMEYDLDVIPTICHLSTQPHPKNVICFVKALSVFTPLAKLLEQMISKPVFWVTATGQLTESIKQALHSPTGCLILCNMHAELPTALRDIPIRLTIHLGWVDTPTTYLTQIQHSNNTVILSRREIQAPNGQELLGSLARAGVSPASTTTKRLYNRQTTISILEPGRKKFKELLSSSTSISNIRSSYMGWITHHCQGQHRELEWTAVDVVTHANKYFKGLFRCGFGGDVFQEQPTVTRRFVEHHGLEAAEAVGLLIVRG